LFLPGNNNFKHYSKNYLYVKITATNLADKNGLKNND